jgi:CDP-diacylglycerol---glycerol-3-phosphate 3-phosphatidyltransferase
MNLANRVTLGRLLFALVSCGLLLIIQEDLIGSADTVRTLAWWSMSFFIIAAASDALDGYLARRDNTVTAFGRVADPFVDKVIITGSFIFLLSIPEAQTHLRPWMVVLMIFREFLVTGIRGYLESVGIDFGADLVGKWKMVIQSLAVGFLIGGIGFREIDIPFWHEPVTRSLVYLSVALTVVSGVRYVMRASRILGRGSDVI